MAFQPVEEYYPVGALVELISGPHTHAVGTICSNQAHLWNGLAIPYWIHVQIGDHPDALYHGYIYAQHAELTLLRLPPPPPTTKKRRGNKKGDSF